ncbi:uncharacterized protein LOC125038602 [Penaeus chinensis]|uniref:uncharacterized protein LOC125038602 n=1 Tax=Penaeus chinensis TaxID=139456 RepID=UPI001FB68706|nr:uncharacterized protein LOC125038602 [Penaeus chinensis]
MTRTKFLCQTTMCPIKNEDGDTCMFIVNFQDLTEKPEDEEEEASTPTDNTIQSRFNRARASFRQSFKMGSLRRGRSPASTSPGSRMEPILDHPAEEPQEEDQDEDQSHSGREPDDSDQNDPLLATPLLSASEGGAEGKGAQTTGSSPPPAPSHDSALAVPVKTPAEAASLPAAGVSGTPVPPAATASGNKPTPDALQVSRPSIQAFLEDRKTSLPIWRRKDSAASRKDSVATTTSKASDRLGSFAEESGRSRASMRPATSLDAISHHRVNATGREFPSRSATISTTARNHVTKPFPNASSESDLSRYRTRLKDRKSPSLSNLTAEGMKHKFSFQDPNAAKGLFPNSKGHQKIDKVAHVGQVVSCCSLRGILNIQLRRDCKYEHFRIYLA